MIPPFHTVKEKKTIPGMYSSLKTHQLKVPVDEERDYNMQQVEALQAHERYLREEEERVRKMREDVEQVVLPRLRSISIASALRRSTDDKLTNPIEVMGRRKNTTKGRP